MSAMSAHPTDTSSWKRLGIHAYSFAAGAGGNTKLHHIPKLQVIPGVDVVKIANRSEESAAKVCKEFGVKEVGNLPS